MKIAGLATCSAAPPLRLTPATRWPTVKPLDSGGAGVEDHAGEVDAEREGRLGLELVLPTAQQEVGERDADAVHLDQHVVGGRDGRVDLAHLDVGGTGERDDLDCAHGSTLATRTPLVEEVSSGARHETGRGARQPTALTSLSSKCIGSV